MEYGHLFLKRIGKTKLRPGGVKGTKFILDSFDYRDGSNFLEGACNKGVNLLKLAKKYPKVNFYGIDLDYKAIKEANDAKEKLGLKNVTFLIQNLANTKFEDNFFDYIINEAVLTMMPNYQKTRTIREMYRILKPNGIMGSHCIMVRNSKDVNYDEVIEKVSNAVGMKVLPLYLDDWKKITEDEKFKIIKVDHDLLTLMNPRGLIRDEGLLRTIKILINGHKKENRERFKLMKQTFLKDLRYKIEYLIIVSEK